VPNEPENTSVSGKPCPLRYQSSNATTSTERNSSNSFVTPSNIVDDPLNPTRSIIQNSGQEQNSSLDTNYKPLHKLITLIKNNPYHQISNYNFSCMFHSMEDQAGINWHDDGRYKYGITYYINRRWNSKFGGEFLFKSKNVNGFIPLVGNSLVIVKPPLLHKVVNVTKPLVSRKTIQIFVYENENKND